MTNSYPPNFEFRKINGLQVNVKYIEILKKANLLGFQELLNFQNGTIFRKNSVRTVMKIEIPDSAGTNTFHLKRHNLSLKTGFKSFFSFQEAEDGKNEWNKILLLHQLHIPTMVPVVFGERKTGPFFKQSLTLTEHLYNTTRLEEYIDDKFSVPQANHFDLKKEIVYHLANLAKKFHGEGLNHNDFYLGHFFIAFDPITMYLIDLQRIHQRKKISEKARVKDLAQLLFSSTQIKGVNIKDRLRFMKFYIDTVKLDKNDRKLIKKVQEKAKRIHRHTQKMYAKREKKSCE